MLHPQLKLKYFQQRRWPKNWIDTAEAIVREEYVKYDTPSMSGPIQVRLAIISLLFTYIVMTVDNRS